MRDYLIALVWFCDDYKGWGNTLCHTGSLARKYLEQWFNISGIYLHFHANAFNVATMNNIRRLYADFIQKYAD